MGWFLFALLVLAVAWVFDLGLLAYAMYALLAALAATRWLTWVWGRDLRVERVCAVETARVGDTVTVTLRLRNAGWLPIGWALCEDMLDPEDLAFETPRLGVRGPPLALHLLLGGERREQTYRLKCNRRGYYQIGPTIVETGDPLGLHRRFRVACPPQFLLVLPEVTPLGGYDLASRRPLGEVRVTHRLHEDPTRFAGAREHQRGDPLNQVHWRATARAGKLHSKVYEPSTVAGATIVMEFHRAAHDPRHEPARGELAVRAAASIAHALYLMGQQVGLASNGRDAAERVRVEGYKGQPRDPAFVGETATRQAARAAGDRGAIAERLRPVRVPTRRGAETFQQVLEQLARLELNEGLALAELLIEIEPWLPRDATAVVITPPPAAEAVIALENLRRQGRALTVLLNVYDPHEFSVAAGPLLAAGVDTRQLASADTLGEVCRRVATRA